VEVLLDVFFSIHLADWRFGYNMISIIIAIMLNIVAKGSDYQGQIVEVIELSVLHQVLSLQNQMNVLSNICSVKIIVVLNRSLILVVDLDEEL